MGLKEELAQAKEIIRAADFSKAVVSVAHSRTFIDNSLDD